MQELQRRKKTGKKKKKRTARWNNINSSVFFLTIFAIFCPHMDVLPVKNRVIPTQGHRATSKDNDLEPVRLSGH